jgi:hypothetical protein
MRFPLRVSKYFPTSFFVVIAAVLFTLLERGNPVLSGAQYAMYEKKYQSRFKIGFCIQQTRIYLLFLDVKTALAAISHFRGE